MWENNIIKTYCRVLNNHNLENYLLRKRSFKLNPWERDVGLVFQNYALWPHMTVFKNISFGLEEKKVPKNEINDRVDDVLELVGMQELKHRYPYFSYLVDNKELL